MSETERAAWERGYTAGKSITMRRMSDEPKAPDYPNPYPATGEPTVETLVDALQVAEAAVSHMTAVLVAAVPDEDVRADLWRDYWRRRVTTLLAPPQPEDAP